MNKTNDELLEEYREISRMMTDLIEHNRYREHEMLLPRRLELSEKLIDWGFRAGDPVERRTGRGWEEDTILEVEGDKFHFRTMILPPAMIRHLVTKETNTKKQTKYPEYEQINLF